MTWAMRRLKAHAPPPPDPVETGDPARWPEVEKAMGTALPRDYKDFTATYGSGRFDELLWLFNPFAPGGDGNLVDERDGVLADYAASRRKFPDHYPLPPWPEPGGVLPLGRSDNGNELYWVTKGEPDDWQVAIFGSRSPGFDLHDGGIVRFLADLVSGRLETSQLPDDVLHRQAHTFSKFD
jgi:hypothetical protein